MCCHCQRSDKASSTIDANDVMHNNNHCQMEWHRVNAIFPVFFLLIRLRLALTNSGKLTINNNLELATSMDSRTIYGQL